MLSKLVLYKFFFLYLDTVLTKWRGIAMFAVGKDNYPSALRWNEARRNIESENLAEKQALEV